MSDPEQEPVRKMMADMLSQLGEHCDSVRIFVTHHRGGEETTYACTLGAGNYYAQLGQVKQWLEAQDEDNRDDVRKFKRAKT